VVGFPFGYNSSSVKLRETRKALKDGASEIDMVMNIGAFLGGDYMSTAEEISEVSRTCRKEKAIFKVIVECCYLTDAQKVKAALLAVAHGADYIKTSTGFGPGGASVADVSLIRRSLKGRAMVKAAAAQSSSTREATKRPPGRTGELIHVCSPPWGAFGLRVAGDCASLEEHPAETEVLFTMMELIIQDGPYSFIAEELNRRGYLTRQGGKWSAVAVFEMLPRLIEAGPRIFSSADWHIRRQRSRQQATGLKM
jgi:hypothetical protein